MLQQKGWSRERRRLREGTHDVDADRLSVDIDMFLLRVRRVEVVVHVDGFV